VTLDLFAGICVKEFSAARVWYEQLLGREPSFLPHATEAVWELAEHRSIAVVEDPRRAGYAHNTVFVEDFDAWVAAIAARGIEPAERETYSNGVRKAIYRDPDGNELGFGGPPA
jgi:catechol 2,3-dioxygenase-like lactoylglutathione lyase family enzyme